MNNNWICCSKEMPPDDYNYPCKYKHGENGEEVYSNGGEIYDICTPETEKEFYWKPII